MSLFDSAPLASSPDTDGKRPLAERRIGDGGGCGDRALVKLTAGPA